MKYINFISCGMLGDFIHCLSAVKNICDREGAKANIYLSDNKNLYGGDVWRLGSHRAHQDLFDTVISQSFVNKFEVLVEDFNESYINLNIWRHVIIGDYMRDGFFSKSWSEFLSECYKYEIKHQYKCLTIDKTDLDTKDKVVIHRSLNRHNPSFNWELILSNIDEEIIFLTCSHEEWKQFPFKSDKIKLKIINTIDELAIGINSCKFFIGNQSSPFALASALDVNRLVELYHVDAMSYMNETKYSDNISWYLNAEEKFFNAKSLIKL